MFEEIGGQNHPVLDDTGKNLIVRKVLGDNRDKLRYFGSNINKTGFVSELKSVISEFLQYDIDVKRLGEIRERVEDSRQLSAKLDDISVVYSAFKEYLADNYITSEEILSVLCSVIDRSENIKRSEIILDGFTGFTPVQYKLLRKLLRVCGQVNVTVTLDKREQVWKMDKKYKLFYLSQKTIYHLTEIAREEHCDIAEPIWTGTVKEETRFADNVELGYLERNLFRYPVRPYKEEVQNITVHCLRQPEDEVQKAILEFVTHYGLLGLMTALPTTPSFMDYEAVYLPKNHFIKAESMETEDYLALFYPFDQLDLVKKGIESRWSVSGDNMMVALTMTFASEPMAKTMSFQREYAEAYDWVAQQFKDWAFTLTTSILYYNDYDLIDEDTRNLYRKGMAAFGGIAPSYHIELLDKPTIYWDFHSLLLGIQMMFSFLLVDGEKPLRLCKHCQKVFLSSRSNSAFCSPRCKNQYNVYKSRGKKTSEED